MWDTDLVVIFTGVTAMILILSGAWVLRPFFQRLAEVMDRYLSRQGTQERELRELQAMHDLLERMDQRMSLLEERLDYTESLVGREGPERALQADRSAAEG